MQYVAVYYENQVVGHVPYNLVSAFLRRDDGFAEVTGDKVNRGAGYGLEILCTYRLYGPKPDVDRLKGIVENWRSAGYASAKRVVDRVGVAVGARLNCPLRNAKRKAKNAKGSKRKTQSAKCCLFSATAARPSPCAISARRRGSGSRGNGLI